MIALCIAAALKGCATGFVLPVVAQGFSPATPLQSSAFLIGVLRRDGIIIPFASFDGKRWRTDWPEPKEKVDVPIDVRAVPSRWWGPPGPVSTWQAWVGSEPSQMIHVRQSDWFPAHCWKQIGLRTDYRPAEPPPLIDAQPYPKDGLAVWPPQEIERIDVVPPGEPPAAVVDAFNRAESVVIRNFLRNSRWPHPYGTEERAAMRLTIEAVYAVGRADATRIYYFETSREYRRRDGSGECATVSFGAGWFARMGAGALRPLGFEVALVDCDRYSIRYMLPLGAMRISNRLFWIAQWSGWDYEEYDVIEVKEDKVESAAQRWGGGC